jgi:outer membrane protein OmpA-like peptidoglycan-associated protein
MSHVSYYAAVFALASTVALGPSVAIAANDKAQSVQVAQANPPGNDKKRPRDQSDDAPPPAKQKPQKQKPKQQSNPAAKQPGEQRQERIRQQQERKQKMQELRAKQQQERQQQQEQQRVKQQDRKQQIEQLRIKQQQDRQRQIEEQRLKKQQLDAERARQKDIQVQQPRREVDRAGPRDNDPRRFDKGRNPPTAGPSQTVPAVGTKQAVPPPAQRLDARRAPRRDDIRQSYRRAPAPKNTFDDLKRNRRERTIAAGKLRVIEEPDRRVIVKQNNRTFIRHDESERFRRIAPDARTIRRSDGTSTTFMTRTGGIRIYDVSDRHGRLLYRYRRYPNGREVILIDNRRHYNRDRNRTRDVLIGAGIGLFIGSAIALAAPDVRIPRDEYIVDYGRASDDDLYYALTAPPIERLDRGYSLDEIRYSAPLRDRMRRIDLDTVTFDFGSWEVGPDQGRALDRLADGINRVLQRNPDEIFMIEGHTDAVGSEEDNLTLSDRRAQSVAEILTTEYGVAPENLVTQGYGEEHLKIPTDGPERLNRRITVRRIGPLLSGQFEDDRYSGAAPASDTYDDGPPDDGLPAVVPPDGGRTYDDDNNRYR